MQVNDEEQRGINANQTKWIALCSMTIDHSYDLINTLSICSSIMPILKIIGRIAAPLFLFLITESAHHTRSRKKFVLRLYFAGIGTSFFTILTNLIFHDLVVYTPGNIIFTYFYTVVYIYLIEYLLNAIHNKSPRKIIISAVLFVMSILPQQLFYIVDKMDMSEMDRSTRLLLKEVISAIFPPVLHVEYSILFILMGVLMYFFKEKWQKGLVLVLFSVISIAGILTGGGIWPINGLAQNGQYWMVLALPFILLYNGQRGRGQKIFFYVYYPLHRYLFTIVNTLLKLT